MYDKKITSSEPTLLILLLDQSISMKETMTETQEGEVYSVAKIAKIVSDPLVVKEIMLAEAEGSL